MSRHKPDAMLICSATAALRDEGKPNYDTFCRRRCGERAGGRNVDCVRCSPPTRLLS